MGGRIDPEDLVQETFISFLRALPGFREEASLETYLFTILRRKIIDAGRGRKMNVCLLQDVLSGAEREEDEDTSGRMAAADPTASFHARREEERQQHRLRLTAALTELIDNYKAALNFRDLQIVEMLFFGQFRNQDVAEVLGVDEKHVAVIKHRCLSRLRKAITADDVGFEFDPPDSLLSEVWQEQRLSCPKRHTLGAYLLGTLEPGWQAYVQFHLERLGCRFCLANYEDLRRQTSAPASEALRQRIMQSTVGFLKQK